MNQKPSNSTGVQHGISRLTDEDIFLFKSGSHFRLYDKLGAHVMEVDGVKGTLFSVWATSAKAVSVIGDFNAWNPTGHPLSVRWDESGIWEGFVSGVKTGMCYKYRVESCNGDFTVDKGDPYAYLWEVPPKTASVVWNLEYEWQDQSWMNKRKDRNALNSPMSVYEVHLGSWKRKPDNPFHSLSYRELAEELPKYVKDMGLTHVELMPVMEHPFFGSWGYQITGYFSPSNRYGTPQDFMFLVDSFHQQDIGVIVDWVPSHFPSDEHGLVYFDGTHLYEHADSKKGFHPDWSSYIYNYGRNEVRAFLVSNAVFWLDKYHIDGLRVDAVASLLYLDYSRKEGEWIPNEYGGRENLEAIHFLKTLNEEVYSSFPDVQMIAEESTAWPMVSRPTYLGGLGFGLKWNMGWMNDTLRYFSKDPIYRKHHHNELTFSMIYAFTENFVLSISHDEMVHGKRSLLNKMPGDDWQKFANVRLLFGYMFSHPGKKLLFMGSEFGQWDEWNHDGSLDWYLLETPRHAHLQRTLKDLNAIYKNHPSLYEDDFTSEGFEWIDGGDWESSIICFLRKDKLAREKIMSVCNFTPTPRHDYRVGVTDDGEW